MKTNQVMTGCRRRRWTREQKQALVETWRESGVSRLEFSQNEGLCYGSFLRWIKDPITANQSGQAKAAAEAEAEFVEVLGEKQSVGMVDDALEVMAPNGWRIRVSGGLEVVERLLQIVSRC